MGIQEKVEYADGSRGCGKRGADRVASDEATRAAFECTRTDKASHFAAETIKRRKKQATAGCY